MTEYKDTLNLPQTDFSMRASLGEREPEQIEKWQAQQIYQKMLERRADAPLFLLHDGPPYANGDIHHGHVLNKALKDFVVKYKSLSGFYTPLIPGWDCHGLPIEHNVEKGLRESGEGFESVPKTQVRKMCREYASKYVQIQRDQFKRTMAFGDWDYPYLTMDYSYEAATLRQLGKFFGKNLVYRGLKPVHWDWASQTALAEAEIEYKAFKTEHVYVKFALQSYPEEWDKHLGQRTPYCVIWTTTPWTLPSNLGIALGPDLEYSLVGVGDDAYVIADGLRQNFETACGLQDTETLFSFKGSDLVGNLDDPIKYYAKHPFIDRTSALLPADFVTLEQGTGCVHSAPGHGIEDFLLGQKYDLGVINPVDDQGCFKPEEVERWGGDHVFKANKKIQAFLDEIGVLLNKVGDKVTIERYPHGWRSKKPVIFRATTQWFVTMDGATPLHRDLMNVRQEVLDAIERIGWVPSWGRDRIVGMVENRPDWCISRQRTWGVPITVFHCPCGHYLADEKLTLHIADLFEEYGADVWFERPPEMLVPEGTTCPKCNAPPSQFTKDHDILDVWFDSGTSWAAVIQDRLGIDGAADLYLEGSDQHRGWFNSSLTCKIVTRGSSPFRTCLTHGFVNDENGHKYSKSSKNFEPPQKMIDTMGAEILRLWVAAVDYRSDITLSPEIIGRTSDAYRKIRNTIRYLLGNLYDFSPNDALPYTHLLELDRWLLDRASRALQTIQRGYESYQFHLVFHTLVQFCTVDLSNVHMDISKDRMYCEAPKSLARRSGQTTYYMILEALLTAIAPILSFTAEEAWGYFPKHPTSPDSVFLTDFPTEHTSWADDELAKRWEDLLKVRSTVQKALEARRGPRGEKKPGQIGSSQEAIVELTASGDTYQLLKEYQDSLAELFIVSKATLEQGDNDELKINIIAVEEGKCPRCWNYWVESGEVCGRCADVLRQR